MTLPAFVADRRSAAHPQLSIDISCPQGVQQQTHVDGWDRLMDGRTRDRFVDPTPHSMPPVSIRDGEQSFQLVLQCDGERSLHVFIAITLTDMISIDFWQKCY